MFKLIVLLKRKRGTTPDQFRAYYEEHHAPLVRRCAPLLRRYVRNYLSGFGNEMYPTDTDPFYDCVTEAWFDNQAAFKLSAGAILEPTVARQIAEDEERFLDRAQIRWFVTEEVEGVPSKAGND